MVLRGFYIISDKFFTDYPDPYLKGNDCESRPHYYCFKDDGGLYWVIPTSARHQKYQAIIDRRTSQGKPTDFLHIAKLDNGRTNAFLIGDMFPITEEYVLREYRFCGSHLTITSETLANEIEKKAKVALGLLRRGYKFSPTQPNVLKIEKELLEKVK
jgi:hypothetical protein